MSAPAISSAPQPTVPPEVVGFAREQGVEQCLPELIALSRRSFPSATRFEIQLDEDPEIADDRHIVFRLAVPLEVLESPAADRPWIEGLYRLCPKALVCVFRLSLDLAP